MIHEAQCLSSYPHRRPPMTTEYTYFATVPLHMERLLAEELIDLGAQQVQHTVAGVHFKGSLEVGYRALLWTRLANRVVLNLAEVPASTAEELYEGVRTIDWSEHMGVDDTLKVTFTSVRLTSAITHSKYGALTVKDAVVDQFRETTGQRPSVDREKPDLHINCHVDGDEATLSIDLAGRSLHRRSYRVDSGKAPIKENVAAAVLLRAGWPEISPEGRPLFDPMCGSGTLLIEGALMASDHAPGLLRDYFGVLKWRQHDKTLWKKLIDEATERANTGKSRLPVIKGSDIDKTSLRAARRNARSAGFKDFIEFEHRAVRDIEAPAGRAWPGLLVTNAPYGERLDTESAAAKVHRQLGEVLRERFPGWKAAILTGCEDLGRQLGLSADKVYRLYNGPLECMLLNIEIFRR